MGAFHEVGPLLADLGRYYHARGWVLGTSGNFSMVVQREPLRLAITGSGLDKNLLTGSDMVEIDQEGKRIAGFRKPSDEALLHLAIVRVRGAGAVLHTHSVWSTILSEGWAAEGGLRMEGFEMLKGLEGVTSHRDQEWLPIIENSQHLRALALQVEEMLTRSPQVHGFLLRRHGLYTWGRDLANAKRHVEILEFLLEVIGRERCSLRSTDDLRSLAIRGAGGETDGYC